MKRLLSLAILFISHGLLGADGTSEVRKTDNGTITLFRRVAEDEEGGKVTIEDYELAGFKYNNNERKRIPPKVSREGGTAYLVTVEIIGGNPTYYGFSKDPEKETLVKISGEEFSTTHALVFSIEAHETDRNGKIKYSASEIGEGHIENWGGTNNKTEPEAQERFKLLKSIFEKTGNTRDLGPKSSDLFQFEQLSLE